MNYIEFAPTQPLARFVKCFWTLDQPKSPTPAVPEPVMPDGCLEIIFNLSDPFRRYHSDGIVETQPRAIIAGQMRCGTLIEPSGAVSLFGIRFHHAGAYPFFRFPLNELTDSILDLDLVWGEAGGGLQELISGSKSTAARVKVAEGALYRLLRSDQEFDGIVETAATLIAHHRGRAPIEQISAQLNISGRRLERRFQQRIGIAPKFFSRIIRFQNLLNLVRQEGATDISSAGLAAGYYDQAHLIHEFKEFSSQTPGEFFAREHELSEVFIAA